MRHSAESLQKYDYNNLPSGIFNWLWSWLLRSPGRRMDTMKTRLIVCGMLVTLSVSGYDNFYMTVQNGDTIEVAISRDGGANKISCGSQTQGSGRVQFVFTPYGNTYEHDNIHVYARLSGGEWVSAGGDNPVNDTQAGVNRDHEYYWSGSPQSYTNYCYSMCYTNRDTAAGQAFSATAVFASSNMVIYDGFWLPMGGRACLSLCDTNPFTMSFRLEPTPYADYTNWTATPNTYTSNSPPAILPGTNSVGGVLPPVQSPEGLDTNHWVNLAALSGLTKVVAKESKQVAANTLLAEIRDGRTNSDALLTQIRNGVWTNAAYQSAANGIAITNTLLQSSNQNAILGALMIPYAGMTNFLGTNGFEGMSNTWGAEGYYMSNALAGGIKTVEAGQSHALTNITAVESGDEDIWMFPIKTNITALTTGYINMDPRDNVIAAGLFAWVKLTLKFYIQFVVFMYMVRRLQEAWISIIHTPGSGLGKQSWWVGIALWLKSNTFAGMILLGAITVGTGALDTAMASMGAWWSSPFSSSGIASVAGAAAPYVRAAIQIVEAIFPISYIGIAIGTVFAFDLIVTGHVVFASRAMRAVTE